MTLGNPSSEGHKAPGSADEDATLDIVRLLIETESRHAEAHPERRGEAEGDAGNEPAGGRVAPRRVTLRGQPKLRGRHLNQDNLEAGDIGGAASDGFAEDLRPKRFGLRLPRLKLPGRRSAQKPARAAGMNVDLEALKRYGKLAGLMGLALVVLFKPWLIPLVLFIFVWLALIVFLLLGSARISELLEGAWALYVARRPKKAARIITRLQNAADRLDGILARMPERLADGIFTPDLGRSERDMARENVQLPQDDPFERLARGRQPAE